MIIVGVALLAAVANAAVSPVSRSTMVSAMTAAEENSYTPAALFAHAAYCPPSLTSTWSCGASCDALPGFAPYGSGGDGDATQYCESFLYIVMPNLSDSSSSGCCSIGYVGYDPTYFQAIVVAHQGTNTSQLLAIVNDADLLLSPLDSTLFPGIPSDVEAHSGFQATHGRSAPGVLAAVEKAMTATGSTKVVITGHSLGSAISLLDALYLPLHLPSTTTFSTSIFGLPRVGNLAFADWTDARVTNLAYITNKHDPFPNLPPKLLGFARPSGEKHIVTTGLTDGDWYACTGQDNTSVDCSAGAVPIVLLGDYSDHYGPYGTVYMGSCADPYES
ncbi:lipase [Clavulina sp. PMI_390]|nr:lipase [Clavulina sp. PMI_390]